MTKPTEIILTVREHQAVKAVQEKKSRAAADVRRLEEIAAEADREALEAREALGRIELAREMGEKQPKGVSAEEAHSRLTRAEAKAAAAREEACRRKLVADGLSGDMREAIRVASQEISQELEPIVRELTERYLQAMATTHELEKELGRIYEEVRRSNWDVRTRDMKANTILLPHESPVIPFKTTPSRPYERAMEDHFRLFSTKGYNIR